MLVKDGNMDVPSDNFVLIANWTDPGKVDAGHKKTIIQLVRERVCNIPDLNGTQLSGQPGQADVE